MCACRQKKSFLIADILGETKKKPYKHLSHEPSKPLVCNQGRESPREDSSERRREENLTRFNVMSEVQSEMEMSRVNLEQRRNTYPLYPTPLKAGYPWSYGKEPVGYGGPRLGYYSEQVLGSSLLRSQLAAGRFAQHPFALRQPYAFDRGCCWWGGRRKGGQVRFTAAQTGALERRFSANKYLSPDQRRALAADLRLSDRQVKTWFQNRRAKWRRSAPDCADAASPPCSADDDDDDDNSTR